MKIEWLAVLVLILLLASVSVLSWWLTKKLTMLLRQHNIVDTANQRSMHQGSVPRGGGLVTLILLFITLLGLLAVDSRTVLLLGLIVTLLLWGGLSWWDDVHNLPHRLRLVAHGVFALLGVAAYGWVTRIELATGVVLDINSLGLMAAFISALGIVWMANLTNFMDGMDGLGAGQIIIASITLAAWFAHYGDLSLTLLCLVLSASMYGFLLCNWRPAEIFMGDVGSVTLGAFLTTLMIILVTRYHVPILAALMVFAIFIADASLTLLRRLIAREPIFQAHRSHYYQRLANLGIEHQKIVISAYIAMILCSLLASLVVSSQIMIAYALLAVVVLVVVCVRVVLCLEANATH